MEFKTQIFGSRATKFINLFKIFLIPKLTLTSYAKTIRPSSAWQLEWWWDILLKQRSPLSEIIVPKEIQSICKKNPGSSYSSVVNNTRPHCQAPHISVLKIKEKKGSCTWVLKKCSL